MEPPKKILLLDDHAVVLAGLKLYLEAVSPGIEMHTASRLKDAIDRAQDCSYDLVILDLTLPDSIGLSSLQDFRAAVPDVPVAVFSQAGDRRTIDAAVQAGAKGYIWKGDETEEVAYGLRRIFAGRSYVPQNAASLFDAGMDDPDSKLTPRQLDVMKLLTDALTNKRIANALDISENTVKVHVSAVFRAYDVKSRLELLYRVQSIENKKRMGRPV